MKLVANIIGDVLTSLAKPLGDLQYLACYLRYAAAASAVRALTRVRGFTDCVLRFQIASSVCL